MRSLLRKKSKPWVADSWDGGENIYVWPQGDLIDHEITNEDCVCKPQVEPIFQPDGSNAWMYTHSALDGRDQKVAQERKPTRRVFIQGRYVAGAAVLLVAAQAAVEFWRRR
jgi:hypothetical protein